MLELHPIFEIYNFFELFYSLVITEFIFGFDANWSLFLINRAALANITISHANRDAA